jgi:hypothetical protein
LLLALLVQPLLLPRLLQHLHLRPSKLLLLPSQQPAALLLQCMRQHSRKAAKIS